VKKLLRLIPVRRLLTLLLVMLNYDVGEKII
jgi:hypothetical protein